MNVGICDDDRSVRENLIYILKKCCDNCKFVEFENGEDLVDNYKKGERLDLIFLDIYMSELSGIEVAKLIRSIDEHVQIVFLTSSSEFAVESYCVRALSYVLKPFKETEIIKIWKRFEIVYKPLSILLKDRLFIVNDIVCVESMDKKIIIRFNNGNSTEVTAKLEAIESLLKSRNFMRCHRSFIVNMDYVKRVGECEFIMTTGEKVLIRSKQYNQIKRVYYDYITSF